jgi:hypothetical protein
MNARKIIVFLIGITVVAYLTGIFLLQMLNIYPINNLVLTCSSIGLIALVFLLAIFDYIAVKSLNRVFDFFPDIEGEAPSIAEWTSKKTWRSLPNWITALTVLSVTIIYSMTVTFSFPEMDKRITEYIHNDSILYMRTGEVKGFSFFRGGEATSSDQLFHMDLNIRVYAKNGSFPLKVLVDKVEDNYIINKVTILN